MYGKVVSIDMLSTWGVSWKICRGRCRCIGSCSANLCETWELWYLLVFLPNGLVGKLKGNATFFKMALKKPKAGDIPWEKRGGIWGAGGRLNSHESFSRYIQVDILELV